jgi:hypothetical protein
MDYLIELTHIEVQAVFGGNLSAHAIAATPNADRASPCGERLPNLVRRKRGEQTVNPNRVEQRHIVNQDA